MSTANNDGGPAFPRALPKGEFPPEDAARIIEQHSGMTLRDYFAAKAPAEPQSWFQPVMPQPCPQKPQFPAFAGTEQQRSYVREFDLVMDPEEAEDPDLRAYVVAVQSHRPMAAKWLQEQAKQRYIQWPYAWADAMLKAREVQS